MKIGTSIFDIHAHIAPYIDDGSQSQRMSIDMLRAAYQQGVRSVICSSHDYGSWDIYEGELKQLQKKAQEEGIDVCLYQGCEILCGTYEVQGAIEAIKGGIISTINGTEYVLIEFYPDAEINEVEFCVRELLKNGYKPVIAHVERYGNLFKKEDYIETFLDMGCLLQINAYSLEDTNNDCHKATARKLLREKKVSFVGSDAHRTNHRAYCIENGVKYIREHCDQTYARDVLWGNAEKLFVAKN